MVSTVHPWMLTHMSMSIKDIVFILNSSQMEVYLITYSHHPPPPHSSHTHYPSLPPPTGAPTYPHFRQIQLKLAFWLSARLALSRSETPPPIDVHNVPGGESWTPVWWKTCIRPVHNEVVPPFLTTELIQMQWGVPPVACLAPSNNARRFTLGIDECR